MSPTARALLALIAPALAAVAPAQDRVVLADGSELEGRVVFEDRSRVVLRQNSRDREIPMAEVESVESVERDQRTVLDRLRIVRPDEVAATLELARFCALNDLPGEARALYWRVLSVDPENEVAHRALDHDQRGDDWFVRHRSKRLELDERIELLDDWGDAWELESLHFRLRTTLPLAEAVETLFDVERFYESFYREIGDPLELHDLVEPMEVLVYTDDGSFPKSTLSERAYFDLDDRNVYVLVTEPAHRVRLFHELTHQLLYHTAEFTRRSLGVIPAWLEEGLAVYLAAAVEEREIGLGWRPGVPIVHYFRVHALSDDPYDLPRVLTFSAGDFQASSKLELKYAQSYTLVHFGLHADQGERRDDFFEFVSSCYEGQASQTDFKRAMGEDEDELEEAWDEYARSVAGI